MAVLVGLVLPFIGKPVHVDDANFLVLARGAAADPWRPHAAPINWQGHTERAFDVLSNPPGIGWWLAPVADQPAWVLHLWMLPWLLVAAWGAWELGRRFTDAPAAATLLIGGAPAAVLAAQSLTPDLPLLACVLAGLAGIVRHAGPASPARRWPWALLLGASALFRYSGAVMVLVALAWPLARRGRRGLRAGIMLAAATATPLVLLALHDVLAYGEVHVLAMTAFQGVSDTPREIFRKVAASLAMLGGAVVLPILCWSRLVPALVGLVGGCIIGGQAATLSHQAGPPALATLLACAAGGAVLGGALPRPGRPDREGIFLWLWLLLGMLFLLKLRFTAARYWLPFAAPVVLLSLRTTRTGLVRVAVPATALLSLLLAWDDLQFARAQHELARRLDRTARSEGGTGVFAGHWGWQHALEQRGWRPLEEDAPIAPDQLLAIDTVAWPQEPAESCLVLLDAATIEGPPIPLPRVHAPRGGANIHASMIAGQPPIETYAPWTLSREPYDSARLWRGCHVADPDAAPAPPA
ncbi:MAG: hypothetical protein D6798_20895, partial [Deltaproteobacteria bacterium]